MAENTTEFPKRVYERLADFGYKLRKHIRVSESAARRAGITPKQYQLMLAIQGYPGRDHATPSELAEQLQVTRHACAELIQRCESNGLISKEENKRDGRSVMVYISSRGKKLLHKITALHLAQNRDSDIFRLENLQPPHNEDWPVAPFAK